MGTGMDTSRHDPPGDAERHWLHSQPSSGVSISRRAIWLIL